MGAVIGTGFAIQLERRQTAASSGVIFRLAVQAVAQDRHQEAEQGHDHNFHADGRQLWEAGRVTHQGGPESVYCVRQWDQP